MKKLLVIITIMLCSTMAFAVPVLAPQNPLFGPTPQVPSIYADGLTRLQVPNLTQPERSAFSQMEALQQIGEVYVQANGCPATPIRGSLDIYADRLGVGDSTLVTPGSTTKITASRTATDSFRGDRFTVVASNGQKLGSVTYNGILANYQFNRSGSIMEGSFVASVPNPTASGSPDVFTGRVIKDFFIYKQVYQGLLRDFTLDWGLQTVSKKGYPVAKYFQRSFSVKDNGIQAVTRFEKVRIAGGVPCVVAIETKGYNNSENFNEQGSFVIRPYTVSLPNVR